MLPEQIAKNLEMLDPEKCKHFSANSETCLQECNPDGKADLTCQLRLESIVFSDADRSVFPYFKEADGCRCCPDAFIFQQSEDGEWHLHIVEFKRTIKLTKLYESRWQFTMGVYNARAIAAVLGFHIASTTVYSAFRNDKVSPTAVSDTVALRAEIAAPKPVLEWKKGICALTVDGTITTYSHIKIQLDDTGAGQVAI